MSGLEFEDGKTHVTDLSASFYQHFQAAKNDISARLEVLQASGTDLNASRKDFDYLSSDIIKLRKDLVDATTYLPSYDQGKCEQQLKALEESLSRRRMPKSKFAFKRKPATASAPLSTPPQPPPPPPQIPIHAPVSTSSITTNLTLSSRASTHLTLSSLVLPAHDDAGSKLHVSRSSDITLTDLSTCIVDLFTSQAQSGELGELTITALHARSLHRVVLVIPPIEGSVLLHDVRDSIVVVGCHQFRMHDSSNTTVLLHALSTPIIEGSNHIQFGEYPAALSDASQSKESFFAHPSQHAAAQDFDWIKPSASPNWSILEPSTALADKVVRLVDTKAGSDVARILEDILPKR